LGKQLSLRPQAESIHPEDHEILNNLSSTGATRLRTEELLFNKYKYFIREGVLKYHIKEEESFDAYCEALLAFIREHQNGRFEGRSSLKTYLYKIFLNKCVDLVRKNSTNKRSVFQTSMISDRLEQLSDSSRSILQQLIDKADHSLLRQQIQLLAENCQKILMYWADNFSDREIAVELEYKSADVVKTSRLRCLEKLKLLYKQDNQRP
jgi:RNA polymerase sigma factor (sigma-70 family)